MTINAAAILARLENAYQLHEDAQMFQDIEDLLAALAQHVAEGQALREERDELQARLSLMTTAFDDENNLANSLMSQLHDAEAALAQLHAAQARLIAQWREQAEVLSGQLRGKAYIMRSCADQLAALVTHAPPKDLR